MPGGEENIRFYKTHPKKASLEKHLGKTVLLPVMNLFTLEINIGNDGNDWMDAVDDNWFEQLSMWLAESSSLLTLIDNCQ